MDLISIVVPIHNEEKNLEILCERLVKAVEASGGLDYEIILVDDGSTDGSLDVILDLARKDPRIKMISFSRNFGHEAATTAGLDRAQGDCTVIIDGDLQDPPEVIVQLVEKWREGFQVVYARRENRPGENFFKKFTSFLFYRVFNAISPIKMPPDTGDFRLVDRRVLLAFRRMGDYNRLIRGMFSWLGFRQTGVTYSREARHQGTTNYGFLKLLWLSFDAMTGFSIMPLRVSTWIGFFVTLVSLMAGLAVLIDKVFWGLNIPGYALLAVGMFFMGGIQLFILGIIGEYIGKIYQQCLGRPLYVIDREEGFKGIREDTPDGS